MMGRLGAWLCRHGLHAWIYGGRDERDLRYFKCCRCEVIGV